MHVLYDNFAPLLFYSIIHSLFYYLFTILLFIYYSIIHSLCYHLFTILLFIYSSIIHSLCYHLFTILLFIHYAIIYSLLFIYILLFIYYSIVYALFYYVMYYLYIRIKSVPYQTSCFVYIDNHQLAFGTLHWLCTCNNNN